MKFYGLTLKGPGFVNAHSDLPDWGDTLGVEVYVEGSEELYGAIGTGWMLFQSEEVTFGAGYISGGNVQQ